MKRNLTPYKIAELADHIDDPRQNRTAINHLFRDQDESEKWPICNAFSVADRAIKQAQRFNRESGCDMCGLEYALFLHDAESRIVNDSRNW